MAISNELGAGGAGFHGDQAKRVRAVLQSVETAGEDVDALKTAVTALATLANELRTDHNALLAKLDADAGVTDTNYVASNGTTAPAVVYPAP
jgi:phage shock protein A